MYLIITILLLIFIIYKLAEHKRLAYFQQLQDEFEYDLEYDCYLHEYQYQFTNPRLRLFSEEVQTKIN